MGTSRAEALRVMQERSAAPKRKRGKYDADGWLDYRVRYLPSQLERARARVAQLEAEAMELGFHDLVERRA